MKAVVTLTAFGKEIGRIEEEVADEAEAQRFFETLRQVKVRVEQDQRRMIGGGYELRQTAEGYLFYEPDDTFPFAQK